ncbi:hypothetical protein HK098_001222 [Nowakowskiella sp. JEL0407]|nr:hypothetical protein HK098_001222 [Nowakowskiella sp. JEL0407]
MGDEWELIVNTNKKTNFPASASLILSGEYSQILSSASSLFSFPSLSGKPASADTLPLLLIGNIEKYLLSNPSSERELDLLCIGIACLYSFLQNSWTGPPSDDSALFPGLSDDENFRLQVVEYLKSDEEHPYNLTPKIFLLVFARIILHDSLEKFKSIKSAHWWAARTLFVQQRILENPSSTLREEILECMDAAFKYIPNVSGDFKGELWARYYLEYGLIRNYYHQDNLALEQMKNSQSSSNLVWELTGALGKRTKFQRSDVSQLVVVAQSSEVSESTSSTTVPANLALNDDTVLEKIEFADNQKNISQGVLRTVDQCILLAFCLNVNNTNPVHGLTKEEMSPYVSRTLENANNWMVHTMGLLIRSRLESDKSRTVERSVLQLQALVDQFKATDSTVAPVSERMQHIFSILLPPIWDLERELGNRLVSLGVVRSALDIFLRLEMWEDAISCYQLLQQSKEAEELVVRLLKETPKEPKLTCILGDIRKDPALYEKAWEDSGYRNARAMRSLGAHYFKQNDFAKSVECYSKALKINPLFENSWFVMGCAAMRIDDFETAEIAFSRVINIDSENGEAWTNLASVQIRLKRKREAFLALREAIKHNYENYQIWQNYLFTSIDLGEFQEAIRAMERILELRWDKTQNKDTVVDIGCLDILIDAITSNMADADGTPSSKHIPKLESLLNSITIKISTYPPIFLCISRYHKLRKEYKAVIEDLVKAYRLLIHNPAITSGDSEAFEKVADVTLQLVDAYVEFGDLVENGVPVCSDWKYQAKMTLKTLISRTKSVFDGTDLHEKLKDRLEALKN